MNDPIIRQCVRRCHIGSSNITVIRYVISRLKNKRETFTSLPKNIRKEFMLQIVRNHNENGTVFCNR